MIPDPYNLIPLVAWAISFGSGLLMGYGLFHPRFNEPK